LLISFAQIPVLDVIVDSWSSNSHISVNSTLFASKS